MKNFIRLFFANIVLVFGLFSCQKTENINPKPSFSAKVGNVDFRFKADKISLNKGITILMGSENDENRRATMVITVRGTDEGIYKQKFDYKTKVSVTQCGLTYKIVSKNKTQSPQFFISYEGSVSITDINRDEKTITGSYEFRIKSIPETIKFDNIKGEFVNLAYQ